MPDTPDHAKPQLTDSASGSEAVPGDPGVGCWAIPAAELDKSYYSHDSACTGDGQSAR